VAGAKASCASGALWRIELEGIEIYMYDLSPVRVWCVFVFVCVCVRVCVCVCAYTQVVLMVEVKRV